MQLVVGLGNPGLKYVRTRHNLGFRVLDELTRELTVPFTINDDRYAWAEQLTARGKLILLKPLTYMNRSGEALVAWSSRSGIPLSGSVNRDGLAPIVVCDDLTLPLGSLRIRSRGSAGGQKGLASIIAALGGEEFPRVRLGISPRTVALIPEEWSDYVLEPFRPDEEKIVTELVLYATEAVNCLLTEGPESAAVRYNRREGASGASTCY